MSHRHYHGLFEAIVVGWIADRARRRYGMFPVALIGLGIAAFWIHPALGLVYAALLIACGLLWLLWRAFIAFGDFLSVEANEERERVAAVRRAKIDEDEAAVDWGAQAWARIKAAPVLQADPRYHGDILNTARAAIARGEKPCPVADRLIAMGVEPSIICREHNVLLPHERAARRAAWLKILILLVVAIGMVTAACWL